MDNAVNEDLDANALTEKRYTEKKLEQPPRLVKRKKEAQETALLEKAI